MKRLSKKYHVIIALFCLMAINTAKADQVKILAADFKSTGHHQWLVEVTLQHADMGWRHYADRWRIVDDKGTVLATRVLYHPHVDEQPFTRGLRGVKLPDGIKTLYIEAHDTEHGWATKRLKVNLQDAKRGQLRVVRNKDDQP